MSKPAPSLGVPSSSSTVSVRIIDSTTLINFSPSYFFETSIYGHDDLAAPAYVFLITNTASDGSKRHILFDLGVRSDPENLAPTLRENLKHVGAIINVEKGIAQILDEAPTAGKSTPSSKEIEAIVWSHHHFDHTGNPSTFPSSTTLVVGPGFKSKMLPGYPEDEKSSLTSSDWEGRELREIDFPSPGLKIGGFKAFDYFGDGSFYLLDTPGHAVGHVCGFARVSVSPDTFVFMGGDAAHHGAEFKPTEYHPLPDSLPLTGSFKYHSIPCPGEVLLQAIADGRANANAKNLGSRTEPWYEPLAALCYDKPDTVATIRSLEEFDAQDSVFVIIAHDGSLKETLKWFPEEINGWAKENLDKSSRWYFIRDFAKVVDDFGSA
ncbi:hypothetical protein FH972_021879 [Carpinus fangiana]|uniref:Metallo-beta-lactamase domain-containing protein n=1 Tax=Carpinus fangiana TaxID=176857 RepID=A0A5N6KR66_9ROSI|nr:hypothetical protein FH972_021879 [Carpinus fangiana]